MFVHEMRWLCAGVLISLMTSYMPNKRSSSAVPVAAAPRIFAVTKHAPPHTHTLHAHTLARAKIHAERVRVSEIVQLRGAPARIRYQTESAANYANY